MPNCYHVLLARAAWVHLRSAPSIAAGGCRSAAGSAVAGTAVYGYTCNFCALCLQVSMHISQNKDLQNFEVMSQVIHEESLIGRLVENPKPVHSHINSKKSAHSAVGPLNYQQVSSQIHWK